MERLFPLEEKSDIATPYGSATVYGIATKGRTFFFMPRHGTDHSVPPHLVNFKANLQALKALGVGAIIATSAVGSISGRLILGEMGLLDQFIDLSKRHVTFFEERPVHVDMTNPYDGGLQRAILSAADKVGERLTTGLVYASVDGPRYETAAEIRMFGLLGADVVGMTGAPEAILANELGIRYASIVIATNWAAGMQERVSHEEVVALMALAAPRVERIIERAVASNRF